MKHVHNIKCAQVLQRLWIGSRICANTSSNIFSDEQIIITTRFHLSANASIAQSSLLPWRSSSCISVVFPKSPNEAIRVTPNANHAVVIHTEPFYHCSNRMLSHLRLRRSTLCHDDERVSQMMVNGKKNYAKIHIRPLYWHAASRPSRTDTSQVTPSRSLLHLHRPRLRTLPHRCRAGRHALHRLQH